MTTFQHLDRAVDDLELAALHYLGARRIAEFNAWPQWYLERIDVLRRATVNLRLKMLTEMANTGQKELFEEEAEVEVA